MNNKLSIPEIAGLLTEYTGKNRKNTELFLKEFIAVVSEGVFTDRIVKIKGIGTFKIIPVEQRESIHVNTGERIVIPPHYKFSFIPDKDLREEVNKPFSFFETIEINNDVDFPDPPLEPENNNSLIVEEKAIASEKEVPSIEESPVIREPIEEPLKEEPVQKEEKDPFPENNKELLPEVSGDPVVSEIVAGPEPDQKETTEKIKEEIKPVEKSTGKFIWMAATLAVLLLIGGGSFLLLSDSTVFLKPGVSTILPVIENGSGAETENPVTGVEVEVEVEDWKPVESTVSLGEETEVIKNKEVIATVRLEPGNRLTLISLEHYGNKVFWVYIYDYNKATIKDPNNIPVGTEIKVPAPELYHINAKDPASIAKASEMQTTILTGGH